MKERKLTLKDVDRAMKMIEPSAQHLFISNTMLIELVKRATICDRIKWLFMDLREFFRL